MFRANAKLWWQENINLLTVLSRFYDSFMTVIYLPNVQSCIQWNPAAHSRQNGEDFRNRNHRLSLGGKGRISKKIATQLSINICRYNNQNGAPMKKEIPTIRIIETALNNFPCRLTAPCFCQLWIIGPKIRCDIIHACSLSDERANAKAAIRIKIVVGKSGTITPTTPSPRHKSPMHNHMTLSGEYFSLLSTLSL